MIFKKKYKILIVEDSNLVQNIFSRYINYDNNFKIYKATTIFEAKQIIKNELEIECILLDIMLPDGKGHEIVHYLNKLDYDLQIPVIVISALNNEKDFIELFELGCFDYIPKPLSLEQMKTLVPLKIRNAVSNYRLNKFYNEKNNQIEVEMNLAKKFQESFLPQEISNKKIEVNYLYKPIMGVGGDFIDYGYKLDGTFSFFIVDISGHGIIASMVSSLIKFFYTQYLHSDDSITKFLEKLNNQSNEILSNGMFFTCILVEIKGKNLEYANCGHPYGIVINKNLIKEKLFALNPLLGFYNDIQIKTRNLTIDKNDNLFCYTDGAFEIFNSNNKFSQNQLNKLYLKNINKKNTKDVLKSIYDKIYNLNDKKLSDDIVLFNYKLNNI